MFHFCESGMEFPIKNYRAYRVFTNMYVKKSTETY